MVSDMAWGSSTPLAKTLWPNRVTSRSSCSVSRRPRTARAIFKRTEFEPMSTAANVGIHEEFAACLAAQFFVTTLEQDCYDLMKYSETWYRSKAARPSCRPERRHHPS